MFISDNNIQTIIEKLSSISLNDDDYLVLLVGEKTDIVIEDLIDELNNKKIKFFGGVFPGVIYGSKKYENGIVVKKLPALLDVMLFKDMKDVNLESSLISTINSVDYKPSALVLVDGLSANISFFLNELFNKIGNLVSYIGGGGGSLSLKQQKCIFSNEGYFLDAAVVLIIKRKINLGVRHGWQRVTGPVTASKVDKTVIKELNWENAFEAYKEVVDSDSNKEIGIDNFFDIAKGYPFGIFKENNEDIVRDPIVTNEEGDLVCVGEVPENAVLYYLKGVPESLISAAKQAADDCIVKEQYNEIDAIVIDCISRVLFLENDFEKELQKVNDTFKTIDDKLELEGILTLGEISSYGTGLLEFFNKTIVSGIMYV